MARVSIRMSHLMALSGKDAQKLNLLGEMDLTLECLNDINKDTDAISGTK